MIWKKILKYLDLRTLFKKQEGERNINLSLMNGINRISIFMFLICLIVLLVRYFMHR